MEGPLAGEGPGLYTTIHTSAESHRIYMSAAPAQDPACAKRNEVEQATRYTELKS